MQLHGRRHGVATALKAMCRCAPHWMMGDFLWQTALFSSSQHLQWTIWLNRSDKVGEKTHLGRYCSIGESSYVAIMSGMIKLEKLVKIEAMQQITLCLTFPTKISVWTGKSGSSSYQ